MAVNLQKPVLVELNAELKNKFLDMAKDYQSAGDDRYQSAADDFDAFLEGLEMYRTGKNLSSNLVRANTFFLLANDKLIGRGDLRHQLNEMLAVMGGHIGYDVRPSERRKGYGSLILQLTLEKARAIGLEKVFLTCDADNRASAKIIEKNGGKLHHQIFYEPKGKLISQYWIEL
jgi:predicted acetyltransferase